MDSKTPRTLLSYSKHLELAAKIVAVFAVVVYALGIVTVNAFLEQLGGSSDFSLLHERYLFAGAHTLFVLIVPMATMIGVIRLFSLEGKPRLAISLSLIFGYAFAVAFTGGFDSPATAAVHGLFILMAGAATVVLFGMLIAGIMDDQSSTDVEHAAAFLVRFLFGLLGLLALLGFSMLCGRYVYPNVERALGGGKPVSARLVIAPTALDVAKEAGLLFKNSTHVSDPVLLLFEGDENLIVRAGDGRIVELGAEMVWGKLPEP